MTNETEIKLAAPDLPAAQRRLEALGFTLAAPRVFERNIVLDDATQSMRASGRLLRLRSAGEVATVTFKGVALRGKHKSREERETTVGSFAEMLVIFERLGYREVFVYEKYRTEYRAAAGGVVTLDETPAGNYLEIEGEAEWIDVTAKLLGYREADYITASYANLYSAWCRERGVAPTNMTFTDPRFAPVPSLSEAALE